MPKNGTNLEPMKLFNIQVKVKWTIALSKESHAQVPPAHGTGVRKKIKVILGMFGRIPIIKFTFSL